MLLIFLSMHLKVCRWFKPIATASKWSDHNLWLLKSLYWPSSAYGIKSKLLSMALESLPEMAYLLPGLISRHLASYTSHSGNSKLLRVSGLFLALSTTCSSKFFDVMSFWTSRLFPVPFHNPSMLFPKPPLYLEQSFSIIFVWIFFTFLSYWELQRGFVYTVISIDIYQIRNLNCEMLKVINPLPVKIHNILKWKRTVFKF